MARQGGHSSRPCRSAGSTAPPGLTLAIADSGGDAVTVPFPVASFETEHAGFTGRLHLRNLPTAGGTQIANGGSLPATGVPAGTYDSGEIATPGANVTVTATIGGKTFRAVLAPRAFATEVAVAGAATSVTVHGADPNGGAVALELSGPGGVLARRSALPRAGGGLDASATFALAAPGNSVVTATQGAWTTRTRLGSAGFAVEGFAVAIPDSPAGCAGQHTCVSGSYTLDLAFHDSANASGTAGALGPCHALGPDVSGAAGCGGFAAGTSRFSVVAGGEMPVVDDAITVELTDFSLGSSSLPDAVAAGVRGSLDDGGLHVRGAARQPVTAALSSPRGGLSALKFAKTALSDTGGVTDLGPERNAFPLHVADGATVSLSGAGVGSLPVAFRYRAGRRALGSRALGQRSARRPHPRRAEPGCAQRPADHDGVRRRGVRRHTARSGPRRRDRRERGRPCDARRDDAGADRRRAPRLRSRRSSISSPCAAARRRPSGACPRARACSGAATSRRRSPEPRSPFRSERVPDGPARITATAQSGPSATDYLYVIVDSTPPAGGAGPDQTVPVGRRAVFVTGARDAAGLASVRFRFKTKGNGVAQAAS